MTLTGRKVRLFVAFGHSSPIHAENVNKIIGHKNQVILCCVAAGGGVALLVEEGVAHLLGVHVYCNQLAEKNLKKTSWDQM